MTLTDWTTPTYTQMLGGLAAWLRKAQAQREGGGADALMGARLAPDMFPLATQVRFACRQALEGTYRLRDEDFPPLVDLILEEGRDAGDSPGTVDDALARIDEVAGLIAALPDVRPLAPERSLAHELPNGMTFDFTAAQYVRDWALPQFYFHVVTAYAILRQQGIDLGKADYVAHLFPYLRQADPAA